MTTISPDDAFGLALIAKDPKTNEDLVESLSVEAQPIGHELITPEPDVDPEIAEAADALRQWARTKTP
jgi:hypothetical protein